MEKEHLQFGGAVGLPRARLGATRVMLSFLLKKSKCANNLTCPKKWASLIFKKCQRPIFTLKTTDNGLLRP